MGWGGFVLRFALFSEYSYFLSCCFFFLLVGWPSVQGAMSEYTLLVTRCTEVPDDHLPHSTSLVEYIRVADESMSMDIILTGDFGTHVTSKSRPRAERPIESRSLTVNLKM